MHDSHGCVFFLGVLTPFSCFCDIASAVLCCCIISFQLYSCGSVDILFYLIIVKISHRSRSVMWELFLNEQRLSPVSLHTTDIG